jgi:hypothetical protein
MFRVQGLAVRDNLNAKLVRLLSNLTIFISLNLSVSELVLSWVDQNCRIPHCAEHNRHAPKPRPSLTRSG